MLQCLKCHLEQVTIWTLISDCTTSVHSQEAHKKNHHNYKSINVTKPLHGYANYNIFYQI